MGWFSDFVSDPIGTIADTASKVVEKVADTVVHTIENAIKDPIGTITIIGAVITGGASLAWLPAVRAVEVIAQGGSIEDAAKTAAISYAAANIGSQLGDSLAVDGLSKAANEAIKTAAGSAITGTGAGILRGQGIGDALEGGITAGMGSGISSLVADNADTGGADAKTNAWDKTIGSTVGSAATAALRGKNIGNAAENTLASGLINAGAGELGYAGLMPAVSLASTVASLPTALQHIQPTQGDTASTMSASLDTKTDIPNLSATQTKDAAKLVRSIDSEGQALDAEGNKIGDAAAFGLTKGIDNTWLTQDGQVIASTDSTVPNTPTGMQMVNDTRTEPQTVNNQDGSTTITSPDGSQKIMSPDGTIAYIDAHGNIAGQDKGSPLSILADSLLGHEPDGIAAPMKAAGGGLMSIQPTISSDNNLNLNQYNADPTNSVQMFAYGGMAHGGISSLGSYSDGGRMLKGPGDGMSDDIPASIAGSQPARLANEEFVIPADVVSHLGNGSSEAGAKVLYAMMERVRRARTGNPKQGKQIHAAKFMPKVRS